MSLALHSSTGMFATHHAMRERNLISAPAARPEHGHIPVARTRARRWRARALSHFLHQSSLLPCLQITESGHQFPCPPQCLCIVSRTLLSHALPSIPQAMAPTYFTEAYTQNHPSSLCIIHTRRRRRPRSPHFPRRRVLGLHLRLPLSGRPPRVYGRYPPQRPSNRRPALFRRNPNTHLHFQRQDMS